MQVKRMYRSRNWFGVRRASGGEGQRGATMLFTAVCISAILMMIFFCLEVYLLISSRQNVYTYAEIVADTAVRNFVLSRDSQVEGADPLFTLNRFTFAQSEGIAQANTFLNRHYRAGSVYPTVIKWEWGTWDIETAKPVFPTGFIADPDANAVRVTIRGVIRSNIFDKFVTGTGQDLAIRVVATAVHDEELMGRFLYPHYVVVEPLN